jgi:hypothetical protein
MGFASAFACRASADEVALPIHKTEKKGMDARVKRGHDESFGALEKSAHPGLGFASAFPPHRFAGGGIEGARSSARVVSLVRPILAK